MQDEVRGEFTISSDPDLLNFETICELLKHSYWAGNRSQETIARSIAHSLCFGVYDGDKQIGFARVVTDYATFAYLCDVVFAEESRGKGLGKWLITVILNYPSLQGLRRWTLATKDAQEFYRPFGFIELSSPEKWMELFFG